MTRSLWKGYFLNNYLLKERNKKNKKIWCRNSSIPSFLMGQMVLVHNGKDFRKVLITREKVGFKFGEFVFTHSSMNKVKKSKLSNKKKK